MIKSLFIVPQVTQYRISFFEKLVRQTASLCEWTIIDGEKTIDDGRPSLNASFRFPHRRFPESRLKMGPFLLRKYKGLMSYVQSERPQLIVMGTTPGTLTYRRITQWCAKNNCRLILWSCLWEDDKVSGSWMHFLKQALTRRFIRSADFHITYSSFAKRKLVTWGISPTLIRIAYNGLEIEGQEETALSDEAASALKHSLAPAGSKVLIYVGGLGFDKKVHLLIEALRDFNIQTPQNNLHTWIIGDGPAAHQLKKLIKQYNLSQTVTLLGRIVEGVDSYFQAADCLVLPGCGGLALNQSLYWGKPCIVSHADGTEEDLILDRVTGFSFSKGSYKDLATAIHQFYRSSPTNFEHLRLYGRDMIAKRSNVNYMVSVFIESIENLLQRKFIHP